jgi:hypothetical protein
MAIQPIDLQALFSQVDKVGKSQAFQREGLQIQQAMQQIESQRKAEEKVQSVNEAQDMGAGAEQIKDQEEHGQNESRRDGKHKDGEDEDPGGENGTVNPNLIKDPSLGRNIDISG